MRVKINSVREDADKNSPGNFHYCGPVNNDDSKFIILVPTTI